MQSKFLHTSPNNLSDSILVLVWVGLGLGFSRGWGWRWVWFTQTIVSGLVRLKQNLKSKEKRLAGGGWVSGIGGLYQ